MKAQQFVTLALIAIIGIAVIGCKEDEPAHVHQWGEWTETTAPTNTADGEETRTCTHDATHKETRPLYARSFTIGGVSFVFEFSKDDTTSWTKLNTAVQSYNTYITANPDSPEADTIKDLLIANVTYKIIVDYSDEGKSAGFTATNAQTLKVGSVYLATTNITYGRLETGLLAMRDYTDSD